ncbi:hypothetical protein QC761_0031770 [Podospora bellae-mahoneyi]|uniref:Uncharacterized protein n=1 Tax=Podospora bellae-mahoneyi TaxID=2093777 RepID=A0ABR0FQX1_9PEZI|nr:hypothetical protein QC761_0031770 [Podospora bellae-mahoneyi]
MRWDGMDAACSIVQEGGVGGGSGPPARHAQKPRKHRLDMYRFVLFLKKSSSMFLVANTFMEYGHETRCEEAR